jgi:CPA1 family monovalent cation:H+ antiporter
MVQFLLESFIFMLVGLELPYVLHGLGSHGLAQLIGYGAVVTLVAIAVRLLYTFVSVLVLRSLRRRRQMTPEPSWRFAAFIGWAGMRGGDSLVIALALPLATATGAPFPARDLIIFLTFAVIFFTLIIQGLSLPVLIRRLGVSDGGADADEEIHARLVATKAALAELDALAGEDWPREETVERLHRFYEYRKRRFAARAGKIEDDGYENQTLAYQRTLQAVLRAQREALLSMRSDGKLSNETMNRILRELDLEESRLEI